ncbi:hypothetical protein [Leptolyngbya sp. Heron Island J]|uniref:hypothetical protein n=1 Tax=Leptolyngbya sp. Heron Island J TaxID=1385935 RepID=UPI0003FE1760|nr:hypothetical protein [Leptolyngbya sp. Heron Island J]
MSSSPTPRPTVNFFTSATLLFGGSFSGTHLTALVAPHSQWSGLVGFFMFPVAFIAGMRLWPWVEVLIESFRSLFTKVRFAPKPGTRRAKRIISSFSFIITSVATSTLSGLILTPPAMQVVVDPGYKILISAGIVYGVICWVLIQLGYLQHADVYPSDS